MRRVNSRVDPGDVAIRAAETGEEERLLPLYEWLFSAPGRKPATWDEKRAAVALREAIASPDSVVLVADTGAELIGICSVYVDLHSVRFGYRAWVEDLAVHPDHRSREIGKRLLAAARDWARERGATHLELDTAETRTDAQRFYEREGADRRSISYGWEL
jgi:GNAT superfamily N-acetyltransferase